MSRKILIANRGEIAVRAIRACRELGIRTVAVYTLADKDSLHVKYADEAYCIGKDRAADSYLDIYRILSTASVSHADAIYPGSGFLSENGTFSEMCEAAGIRFIGAKAKVLNTLGNKLLAKQAAVSAGVPIVPASSKNVENVEECKAQAQRIGYPVLLKAAFGGGGKGIRAVHKEADMEAAFRSCTNEALAAFGSSSVFVEKCIENARHVEVQVLADSFGNAVHLFDRDCTMQRKHQKMIEEAVSCFVSSTVKERMYQDALNLITSLHYVGAATVEFLVDRDGNYYFMEVNPRVQVEHPVTEFATGVDIVKEQMCVALGDKLAVSVPNKPFGHAIEVRINAEDPEHDFMSSVGEIRKIIFPGGVGIRVETYIQDGIQITPYYDSMIAKIIAHAPTREITIKRLHFALEELVIEGITTNAALQNELLGTEEFVSGSSYTTFVEDYLENRHG